MKKLELEDFVIKHKINQDMYKVHYLDNEVNQNTGGGCEEISFKIDEKIIELDKIYNSNYTDDKFLSIIINDLLLKKNKDFDITVNDIEKFFEIDKRKIIAKFFMISNKIAVESRIGPANSIIFDNHMFFFNRLQQEENMGGIFNFYYHKGLGDHIIIFRKTTKEQPHIGLFYSNDKFTYDQVGDYSKFYKILKFEGLKQIRTKKLERIIK